MKLYSLRDVRSGGFTEPRLYDGDQVAIRDCAMLVNETGAPVVRFAPADFDLYAIAEFDIHSAMVTPIVPIQLICNLSSLVGEK